MQTRRLPYEKILFVCTNVREPGGRVCCAARGGSEIRDRLKALVKARGLKGRVRVSKSGCMDQCEIGPNIMVFPDNVWYRRVRAEDVDRIFERVVEALEGGEPLRPDEPVRR